MNMNMDKKVMEYFIDFKLKVMKEKEENTFKNYEHIDEISRLALMSNFVSIHLGIEIMKFINEEVLSKKIIER